MQVVKIEERRAKPRVETRVSIKFGETKKTFYGNLSRTGVFLETPEPFAEVGEKVNLELLLPNATESVKVSGKVVRITGPQRVTRTPGMGIQFLRIETRNVRTFERFMDRLLDARGLGSRKYPRIKAQIVVELHTKADVKQAISENVSKGGLFLKVPAGEFQLGDSLHLVMTHPSTKRKFEADARVVHLRKGQSEVREDFIEGVGIEFSGLNAGRNNEVALFLRGLLMAKKP